MSQHALAGVDSMVLSVSGPVRVSPIISVAPQTSDDYNFKFGLQFKCSAVGQNPKAW